MKTVAIVCEYNPFHNGHLYQIYEIRREFGEDTEIIAIMSGNFTQRGETACLDKGVRAKCAVECGVNLVIELPFPFSSSSAEIFARSAVKIADNLGCVDFLSFGSESGDIKLLTKTAEAMLNDEFEDTVNKILNDPEFAKLGYPEVLELSLRRYTKDPMHEFTPNNILAIEYIKALKKSKSTIKPHTIKRMGSNYSDSEFVSGSLQSATAIRSGLSKKDISALEFIPKNTKDIILNEIKNGSFPCDMNRLSTAIIANLRLNSLLESSSILDAGGGLYNRLKDKCLEANNIETLLASAETKGYTRARLRRAILFSFIGVTSSDVKDFPMYTQILALDNVGRAILKRLQLPSDFSVLTKPSAVYSLGEIALRQKTLSDKADSVFQLTKPIPQSGRYALRFTPYVKK